MKHKSVVVACMLMLSSMWAEVRAQSDTQLDINQKAADEATQAEKKVKDQLRALGTKFSNIKGISVKLDESQELWNNFTKAHLDSIFPVPKGEDSHTLYGSMFGKCVGDYHKEMAETRLAELKSLTDAPPKKDLETLKSEYQSSDKTLNDTYGKVMRSSVATSNRLFKKNLIKAEVAWIALRNIDSELYAMISGASQPSDEARVSKQTDMTIARTKQLNQWVSGVPQGDGCSGTYPVRQ